MKSINSLQTKLTASFVILILVVASLTFLITFRSTKTALKELTQSELLSLAAVIASQLGGETADAMQQLKVGDENTPTFARIRDQLLAIRTSHPGIRYIYTMKKESDQITFLVDPDFGNEKDPGGAIGEVYEGTAGNLEKGFIKPAVDDAFTTDRWGTFLSGYAPITNSQGTIIGIVGVDMTKTLVIEKQNFIGNTIYIVMVAGILLAGLFILLFSKTIIRDIHKLNNAANAISLGDTDVHVDVERKDEIGELAESFGRMVASLKIMMMTFNDETSHEE